MKGIMKELKKKINQVLDNAVLDLRHKAKTEEKGNWLSTVMILFLIFIFTIQFLIFEPLIAGLIAFILVIGLTYAFAVFVITRNIK